MATSKSSTPVTTNGATKAVVSTFTPIVNASAPASATASGSTSSTTPSASGVLASLGVKNSGFTQVKVESVVTAAFLKKVKTRLSGMEGYFPADSSITFNGQAFMGAAIVSVLEAIVALFAAKTTAQTDAKAMVATAVAALNTEAPTANQFVNGLDGALLTFFGKGNPTLENFGLSKGVAKPPTVLVKAEALGTAKLTRDERHTMGKVQKAKVKGGTATLALTGPAGQVIAGSLPAAPAPSATPAPAAGSSSGTGNTSGQ